MMMFVRVAKVQKSERFVIFFSIKMSNLLILLLYLRFVFLKAQCNYEKNNIIFTFIGSIFFFNVTDFLQIAFIHISKRKFLILQD